MFVGAGYCEPMPNSTPAENFSRLLTHGYFPKELPPCFSSKEVGQHVFDNWAQLSEVWKKKEWTQPATLNLARYGGLRRRVSVPNLRSFTPLAAELSQTHNWPQPIDFLEPLWSGSWPSPSTETRAFAPTSKLVDLVGIHAVNRSHGSVAVLADVSQFYSSVYTHAIAWALHGKVEARIDRWDEKLAGSRIDKLVQLGQDGQTHGIPIGPDTSFIIGEIVLGAVDRGLWVKGHQPKGIRYYDDYELIFDDRRAAENMLNDMESELDAFGLRLNPLKTRIVELPFELNEVPFFRLRNFPFRNVTNEADVMAYFDEALRLRNEFPRSDVIHYAIGHLATISFGDGVWQALQNLLVQLVRVEPSAFESLARLLVDQKLKGKALAPVMEGFLSRSIIENTRRGRDSEVTWALWLCSIFEIDLQPQIVDEILKSNNSFVALLSLHEWPDLFEAKAEKWRAGAREPDAHKNENWMLSFYFDGEIAEWANIPNEMSFFVEDHKSDDLLKRWLGQSNLNPY